LSAVWLLFFRRSRARRHGQGLDDQQRQPDVTALTFEQRLGLMIDREATERENKRLVVRLKFASLRQAAIVEDVDLRAPRGIDRAFFAKLVDGDWISRKQNLLVTGPTGVGKSWIACALGHKACRDNRSVLYHRLPWLFEALALARGDGRYARQRHRGRDIRSLNFRSRLSRGGRGTGALLFPMRYVIGDDYGHPHRGLAKLQIVGNFPLYPFALAVQEIVQILEIEDHILQLRQRDTGNPLNERIDVRNDLGRAFRLAAQNALGRAFRRAAHRSVLTQELAKPLAIQRFHVGIL
jgi:hypothetical protein